MSPEPPNVDGVSAIESSQPDPEPTPTPPTSPNQRLQGRMKFAILILVGAPYMLFFVWCIFIMTVLPSVSGAYDFLIMPALISCALAVAGLFVIGLIAAARVAKTKGIAPIRQYLAYGRILALLLPGVGLAGFTALRAVSEPPLFISIIEPTGESEIIAPLSITFSMDEAVEILGRKNLRPVSFEWDYNGDGEISDTAVETTATAVYDRAGVYNVSVLITLNDNTKRVARRRIIIKKQVFSITPLRPTVDEPVTFSVENLINAPEDVREIEWDFESDGVIDEVSTEPSINKVFVRAGDTDVTAIVYLQNQTKQEYKKTLTVYEPEPLPFEIELVSEPDMLIGPVPFQAKFRVETEEQLQSVRWDFGDGDTAEGTEVGHTFDNIKNYRVVMTARSAVTGDTAKISKLVKVVELLRVGIDFSGEPKISFTDERIEGEVPLMLKIKPLADLPLIDFFWEAPDASVVGSTVDNLQAIYREPGTYNLFLVAQDPDGKALRKVFKVDVKPPSSVVSLRSDRDGGDAPFTVKFDASETVIPDEQISGFEWLYGDEEDPDTAVAKPSGAVVEHTYEKPGTYTALVIVKTAEGGEYEAKKTIVVRTPVLDACFTPSRTEGKAPLAVKFTMACSTGQPTEVEWDFGDGAQSLERDPIHSFDEPGTYTVTLRLQDGVGTLSTETVDITAIDPTLSEE